MKNLKNKISFLSDPHFVMQLALREAKKAYKKGEVPVGAVLTDGKDFVVKAHNLREKKQSPLSHAEIECLKKASDKFNSWRLENLICVVTLEPCVMCMGALLQARVKKIIFACRDPKAGACGSLFNLASDRRLNHQIEVEEGLYAKESSSLLSQFFKELRMIKTKNRTTN